MPAFYPSCVFHFKLRFDESFTVISTPEPITAEQAAVKPFPIQQKPAYRPLLVATGADNLSAIMNRIPKSANIELPGYRHAGRFSASFAFQDLPIDPRLLRACAVDIHLGPVRASDFAIGMTSVEADGTRRSILDTVDNDDPVKGKRSTLLMTGSVDTWAVEHTEQGSSISIEGRDLRGEFLDKKISQEMFRNLNVSQPIDEVVRDILRRYPLGKNYDSLVKVNPGEWVDSEGNTIPVPSPGDKDGLTALNFGTDGKANGKGQLKPQGGSINLSYWDPITHYCFVVGAIPFFVGYELHIRPARAIFDHQKIKGFDPRFPTPFKDGKPRDVLIGDPPTSTPLRIRTLVYGRDVWNLKFERKYTGMKPHAIKLVSMDPTSKERGKGKLLTAIHPPEAAKSNKGAAGKRARTTSVAPSGQLSETDILQIRAPAGINNQKQLDRLAQDIFEELARQEMGGSCTTKNLHSFGGPEDADNPDADLLHLRPGDPMRFAVDTRALSSRAPLVSELTSQNRRQFEEQVKEILKKIPDENLARVIVATARNEVAELQSFFRVMNVKYSWDAGSGISISFDFQNYVEVRYGDVTPSSGENKSAPRNRL